VAGEQKSYLARVRCYTIPANGTRVMRREGNNLISVVFLL
jgi:hypothetical protein